jgi:hypothetical protein
VHISIHILKLSLLSVSLSEARETAKNIHEANAASGATGSSQSKTASRETNVPDGKSSGGEYGCLRKVGAFFVCVCVFILQQNKKNPNNYLLKKKTKNNNLS